jgi:gliding motility-associated-like protein
MFVRKPQPILAFLLVIFSLTSRLNAQVVCTPVFINEYKASDGGPLQPHALKALTDGTILVAGRAAANGATTYHGFISRHAADGTPMWSLFVGGAGNDDLTGIIQLNDGTFMFFGNTASFGHPEGKGWLMRIDGTGAVLWSGQLGSSITSTDRIKAIQQYADGDLVGTLNTNDSSAASDPVVFKMGLDGTIRWTQRFDNGNDDSFTTLAVSGDTLYAGGYYTAGNMLHGVITELTASTGTELLSRNINNGDATLNEQVTSLEIYNNVISYGLYVYKGVYSYSGGVNGLYGIQTDLAGNTRSVVYDSDQQGLSLLTCKRTADSGFYVLRANNNSLYIASIAKLDWYGNDSWNLALDGPGNTNNPATIFSAFDLAKDGGIIAAGHYMSFTALLAEVLRLVKISNRGEAGSCSLDPYITYTNPSTFNQAAFSWTAEPAFNPMLTLPSPVVTPEPLTAGPSCSSSICLDHTPIPAGCGKTYNIQYTSVKRSLYRDIMPLADGGRVAIGDLGVTDGIVTRFQSNGDILWTKNFNVPTQVMEFRRILLTQDGNLLVIGNNYYIQGNYAYRQMVLLKLDINGNIIWCHFTIMGDTEMSDAVATPDNGIVIAFNEEWGGPGYPWLARFDANGNVVWKKLVTHGAATVNFKAIACSQDAVFVAFDTYDQSNYDKFGVDRVELASGNLVYSKYYSAGSNTQVVVHSVFTIRDSAYVFAYVFPYVFAPAVSNLMTVFDPQGNTVRSLNLGSDPVNPTPPAPQTWIDAAPPSATITPDLDFWLANRVVVSGSDYLEVTRLKADGTVELSKLHTGISNYLPFNVRPQGKGLAVVGAIPAPTTGDADFINSFIVKLDSSGQLQAGAAANCVATDRTFTVTPCTGCAPASFYYGPPATSDAYPLTNTTGSPYNQNNDLTPILYCFQPGNCNSVTLQQKGAACALQDTLVYYLDNSANCGAAAIWSFDATMFRPGVISGDSIQLIVQKAGSTTVGAQIEGYCSFSSQTHSTAIVLSSLTGLGLAADTVICSNGPIKLQATPGYASYLWSDNSTTSSLQVGSPGTYSLVATDLCGHTHDATVAVADANASFHVTPDTIKCNNDVDSLRATSGYSNYQWSPANALQAQANVAMVSPDVSTSYTVTAQYIPGCTVTASTFVTVLSSPPINFGNDTSICSGDSLLLDGGMGFVSYAWSTGVTAERIYVHHPGDYSLAAAYSNGCVSRDTFKLTGLYDPRPSLDSNTILCSGQDRTLDAGPSFSSYLWNDGSTGSSYTVAGTGTYWVTVTDSHGCIGSDTVHILTIAQPPKGFLPQDTSICQYGDLVLTTHMPYDSYTWSDLSAAATFAVKQPGTYWVTVTDNNGCMATDTVTVIQKECLVGLFVPNAFTPDGGSNARFRPLIYGQIELLEFAVFDRFGQRVFQTKQTLQGWDGNLSGSPAPAGTYVWFCKYRYPGGAAKMEKGTVIMLR